MPLVIRSRGAGLFPTETMKRLSIASIAALVVLTACDPAEEETPATSGGSSGGETGNMETGNAETGTTGTTDDSTTGDMPTGSTGDMPTGSTGDEPTGPLVWTPTAGPCPGSGTNALWFDDRMTGFVGCGENASGEGLFTTTDGAVTFEDNVRFGEVRVMDIRRGDDGTLYGAGIHQLDGYPVWSFDEGGMINSTGLYTPSNNAFLAVNQAENATITADGQMLIDSLTGTTAAYRPAGGDFEEVSSLSEDLLGDPDAAGFQVRRIQAHDNRFYAVGSLINDPARVHLPSQLEGATYHFHTVELQPETRDGELLDMHIWDNQHMIVAGHDQSERFPLIYLIDGADPYDSANWEKIELFDSGLEYEGGINDIHVVGDRVVMVGEKFPTSQGGFVIVSEDGGRTFEDITPEDAEALSRVWMFDNDEMVVAGGGGEMWIYAAE